MKIPVLELAERLHAAGRLAEAEACYRQALAVDPENAVAEHYLAVVLGQCGRADEAMSILQAALVKPGSHPDSLSLYALLCRDAGAYAEGLSACERTLRARPDDSLAHLLAGNLHLLVGNYPEAERYLRRASSLMPESSEAWGYLGMTLHWQGRYENAMVAYRRACQLAAGDHKLYFNIALCADSAGDPVAARDYLAMAHRLAPRRADILARLAYVNALLCEFESERQCMTMLGELLSNPEVLEVDDQVEPFLLTFLPLNPAAADAVLRRKAERIEQEAARLEKPSVRVESGRDRPLRLGYLSADFGDHAVGSLISGLFHAHDRTAVSVCAFSLKRNSGVIAEVLRGGADIFHDCDGWPVADVAAAIAADRIDVMIDLAGYTLGARPAILALRPAPLQYGYLGFLHGYGADWIDGIVVDETVCPAGVDSSYPEMLIRLPGTLFPGSAGLHAGVADRERFGLPRDVPIFASFNNSYKIEPELLSAWIEIGRRVPDARFVVYLPEAAQPQVRQFWVRHGGSGDRLIFTGKLPAREHADRSASCDLFLDAFRYQAGATGVAAAAAGLPMLTRIGTTLASRMGASLNRFLGLDELVSSDLRSYVDRAVEIGLDPVYRQRLKADLGKAVGRSGLLDPRRIAAALETAMRNQWQRHAVS